MTQKVSFEQYAQEFLTQLPRGAFLTVKDGTRMNTMTIGWGNIGFIWQRPIITVMVRYSRYTYGLIDNAPDFSVSLPAPGEMRKALAIAGSVSGRDVDKFAAAGVTTQSARSIQSPVIKGCSLIFECRTVLKQIMDPQLLDGNTQANYYASNDYHVMFYGEIVDCYKQTDK